MNPMRVGSWSSVLALCACSQPEKVQKPKAPDLGDVVRGYERPTLDFDPAEWNDLRSDLDGRLAALERSALVQELEDALGNALEQAEASPGGSQRRAAPRLLGFSGSGFVRATRICDGWTTPPVPDRERNGFIEVVIGFTDDRLDPVLFGTLEHCRYLLGADRVRLTAGQPERPALSVHIGEATGAEEVRDEALTFDLDLDVRVGSHDLRVDFDFRALPSGELEFRLPADGDTLVVVTEAGVPRRVRAKNGEFLCGSDFSCGGADAGATTP